MAQVFISYAREDTATASRLAAELTRRGWDVWWDPELVAGQQFDEVIERELRGSGAVVVLWSADSVASRWVRAEASAAADRSVLVPVRIADVEIPLRFINLETVDLTSWAGSQQHDGLDDIARALVALVGQPATPPPPAPPQPAAPTATPRPTPASAAVVVADGPATARRRRLALAGAGLGLVVVAVVAIVALVRPDDGGITAESVPTGPVTTTWTTVSSTPTGSPAEATRTTASSAPTVAPADSIGPTSAPRETSAPPPDHPASQLLDSDELFRGDVLTSDDGRWRLDMQHDGNVTLYPTDDPPDVLFATMTHVDDGWKLRMQGYDGNLVVYTRDGVPKWSSDTHVIGSYASLDDDGHLRVYGPDGAVVWSTEVVVPDVIGQSEQAASEALSQVHLGATVRYVPTGGPPGAVVAVAPGAGTHVYRNEAVTLSVVAVPPSAPAPPAEGAAVVDASTTTTSRIPRG